MMFRVDKDYEGAMKGTWGYRGGSPTAVQA